MSLPEKPLTRRETFLAKAAGQSVTLPEEDLTREEQYLREIAEGGGGGGTQADWSQTDTDAPDYIKNKPTLGTAAAKDSTNAVTENSTDLVESGAVKTAIDTAVSSVYKPAGSKSADEFITDLLIEANLGKVYNASTSGTTTENFVEGAGKTINIGDNVVVVDVGTANEASYKFDLLAGFVDLSGKADKVSSAINGNLAALDASGNLTDSGSKAADFIISGSATGTAITLTDSADARVQGLVIKGRSHKSKNLLEITAETQTINGVTFTVDKAAGTITVNGTATANTGITISAVPKGYGNITFSPLTNGNLNSTYFYSVFVHGGSPFTGRIDMWDNIPLTTNYDSDSRLLYIGFGIFADVTVDNLVIKPMLCTSADYEADPSFEPYGIHSVGDDGLTVTTANSDNTVTTSAEFTTALPLRSVSDEIYDTLDNTKVTKMYEEVDLGTMIWTKYEQTEDYDRYISADIDAKAKNRSATLCAKYETYNPQSPITANKIWIGAGRAKLSVTTSPNEYPDAAAFKTAMSGVMLIYELAEPVITPLTDAEISAFRQLRTFDSTTNINITDEPEFTIDYLKNTDNGKAVSRVVDLLQGTDIKVFTYTGTGTVNHSTTFPEVPTMVLAMFGQHTFSSNTWSVSARPFAWGVRCVFSDWCTVLGTSTGSQAMPATYNGAEITFSGMGISDPGAALNAEGETYTVYYI